MIEEFSFFYFVVVVLMMAFISVSFSCMTLAQRSYVKVSDGWYFDVAKNKWLLILMSFLFYLFLPFDAVRDYIAYAEYYTARQAGFYGEAYGYFSSRDLLFFNYVELMSSLGVSYRLAYGSIISLYVFSFSKIAEGQNINVWMVFLFALAFGNVFFVVSGLRQAAAMAFILIAYNLYVDNRKFWAILCVVVGAGFHGSAFLAAFLVYLCICFSKIERIKLFLIFLCFLSFPLLWWQLKGSSVINLILPYLGFLVPDAYADHIERIRGFESLDNSLGFGFAYFTSAKILFLLATLWLYFLGSLERKGDLVVVIGLFYVFCFNVMGLNQFTHRLLNYLVPFLCLAMSMVLARISINSAFFRLVNIFFVLLSGVFATVVAIR